MSYFQHETAIVDDGARIGEGSRIWHFAHVSGGALIGAGVSLGQNVFVGNKVTIGDRCKVQNNVSIYDNVHLKEGVFCGPSMVFTNVYNPRSLFERKDEYRDTYVEVGATLGANCTIPARQIGWMSVYGEQLDLPISGSAKTVCAHSDVAYQLIDGRVTMQENTY